MKSTELFQQFEEAIRRYRSGLVSFQVASADILPLLVKWMAGIEERLEALEKRPPIIVESTPAQDLPDPNEPGIHRS